MLYIYKLQHKAKCIQRIKLNKCQRKVKGQSRMDNPKETDNFVHTRHNTKKKTNKPQHRKLNSNTNPTKNRCASKALVKCKQLLTPMRHLPCHLHSQNVLDTIIMIPIRHTCYQNPPLHGAQQFYIYVYLETGNIMPNVTSLSYIESEGNYIVFFLRFTFLLIPRYFIQG